MHALPRTASDGHGAWSLRRWSICRAMAARAGSRGDRHRYRRCRPSERCSARAGRRADRPLSSRRTLRPGLRRDGTGGGEPCRASGQSLGRNRAPQRRDRHYGNGTAAQGVPRLDDRRDRLQRQVDHLGDDGGDPQGRRAAHVVGGQYRGEPVGATRTHDARRLGRIGDQQLPALAPPTGDPAAADCRGHQLYAQSSRLAQRIRGLCCRETAIAHRPEAPGRGRAQPG